MPEYMDVHRNMKGITPEDLLKAHQADLDVQDQENADFKRAWGDPETGIVFLSLGGSEQGGRHAHARACRPPHRRGLRDHRDGLTPNRSPCSSIRRAMLSKSNSNP